MVSTNPPIRTILLAVDEFAPSQHAAQWAAGLAKAMRATVDAVTVVPAPPAVAAMGSALPSAGSMQGGLLKLDRLARGTLDRLAGGALKGIAVTPHVEHGPTVYRILALERQVQPDLVILGPRGSGTIRERLGSVADAIKRQSKASVLIAKQGVVPPASIVAGSDGSKDAQRAVAMATALAEAFQIPLDVVESWQGEPPTSSVPEEERRLRGLHPEAARYALARFKVSAAPPVDALLDAAHHAGLLAVGCRGRGAMASRLLGSVSEQVSHDSRVPVLVVK